MSYSLRLPEEPPECECQYDVARDEMDRDDCHFRCDLPRDSTAGLVEDADVDRVGESPLKRKQSAAEGSSGEAAA